MTTNALDRMNVVGGIFRPPAADSLWLRRRDDRCLYAGAGRLLVTVHHRRGVEIALPRRRPTWRDPDALAV